MLMNEEKVQALFEQWSQALQTGDAAKVVELYAEDAILLPTISNKIRRTQAERYDYFVDFIALQPKANVIERYIRVMDKLAFYSGIYAFELKDLPQANARFSFVYQQIAGEWRIIEHHSSLMPEQRNIHQRK